MNYICLLLPPLIALIVYEKLIDTKVNFLTAILYYGLFNVLNNFIVLSVSYFIFNNYVLEFSVPFCIKFLFLSIVNCIVVPYIVVIIEKNVEVKLDVHKKK